MTVRLAVVLLLLCQLSQAQIQWDNIGPFGGDIRTILVDPTDSSHLIALNNVTSLFDGGYKSLADSYDGGLTWKLRKDYGITDYELHPIERLHFALRYTGQFSSTLDFIESSDNGLSWSTKLGGIPGTSSLAIEKSTGDIYLLCNWRQNSDMVDSACVRRSTDLGNSWETIYWNDSSSFTIELRKIIVDNENPDHLILVHRGGVDTSYNGGQSWSRIDSVTLNGQRFSAKFVSVEDLVLHPINSRRWYARLERSFLNDSLAFIRSDDGGATWHSMPGVRLPSSELVAYPYPNSATRIAFRPSSPETMYIATSNGSSHIYRSTNGGISWEESVDSLSFDFVRDIVFSTNDSKMFLTTRGQGIYLVDQEKLELSLSNFGIGLSSVSDIKNVGSTSDTLIATSYYTGFVKSTDSGASWEAISKGIGWNGFDLRVAPGSNTRYFINGIDWFAGRIFHSDDGGYLWKPYIWATDFDFLGGDTNTIVRYFDGSIQKSRDAGITWEDKLLPALMTSNSSYYGRRFVVAHSTLPPYVFARVEADSTYSGRFRFYRSTNFGETWSAVPLPGATTIAEMQGLWVDPSNPFRLFIAYNYGQLARSTNIGASWSSISSPTLDFIIDHQILDLAISPYNGNIVFAATRGGVFQSMNGGSSWAIYGDSTTRIPVYQLEVGKDRHLYAATAQGVYRSHSDISTDVTQDVKPQRPLSFELSQNYPNPFNPFSIINYTIPSPGFVRLNIYNLLGEVVLTVVNSWQETGDHAESIDAGNLASGVYYYRLEFFRNSLPTFSQTKKMLVVK